MRWVRITYAVSFMSGMNCTRQERLSVAALRLMCAGNSKVQRPSYRSLEGRCDFLHSETYISD